MRSMLLAMALTSALGATAQAYDNDYAVVTVENPTSMSIVYDFRWGNGAWESYVLAPGEVRWHSWTYDYPNENRSPAPQIRFDCDLTSGMLFEEYRLEAYASPFQLSEFGKTYQFFITGYLLDLVNID